jgi:hypothetical protein
MMRGLSSSLAPLVGQTQPVHHTRPEVLVEHIELGDQPLDHRQSRSGFQSEAASSALAGIEKLADRLGCHRHQAGIHHGHLVLQPWPRKGNHDRDNRQIGQNQRHCHQWPQSACWRRSARLPPARSARCSGHENLPPVSGYQCPGGFRGGSKRELRATSLMRRRHLGFPSSRLQR